MLKGINMMSTNARHMCTTNRPSPKACISVMPDKENVADDSGALARYALSEEFLSLHRSLGLAYY